MAKRILRRPVIEVVPKFVERRSLSWPKPEIRLRKLRPRDREREGKKSRPGIDLSPQGKCYRSSFDHADLEVVMGKRLREKRPGPVGNKVENLLLQIDLITVVSGE